MEKYFTYVICSEVDGRYYYGQTSNLEKRIEDHNKGASTYTKRYLPWKLVAYKAVETRSEAMKIEKQLKNCKSKEKVNAFIVRHGFQKVIGPEK